MSHLSPDEFVDAAEGVLSAGRRQHLESCDTCRGEAAVLARLLREAQDAPIPEPSPLFWEHFSARVAQAVRAEGAPAAPGWSRWFRWPVLFPLGSLALVAVALLVSVGLTPDAGVTATPSTIASAPPLETDDRSASSEWSSLAELIGPLDWETADAAGLGVRPGDAERAALDLNDEERRELTRLIAGELSRAKS